MYAHVYLPVTPGWSHVWHWIKLYSYIFSFPAELSTSHCTRQIKTTLLLPINIAHFSYITFSYKNMFVRGLLLRGDSNLQCLQGQTGALVNMVCHRIISTINFRFGHQLALSQTRSAGGVPPTKANISRCLSNHIPTAAHFLLVVQLRFPP